MFAITEMLSSLQEFLEATLKYYQADLKAVDFIGAPEACRVEINTWVEEQTESRRLYLSKSRLLLK